MMQPDGIKVDPPERVKFQRSLALIVLAPWPICVLLEVLGVLVLWWTPNWGNSPGWTYNVLLAVGCMPYFGSIALAILGEVLGLTAWRRTRTRLINLLLWVNPVLLLLHALLVGYIYYEIIILHPFIF
jgi:hypothetical protein